jgi:hypothetical protein
MSGPSLRWSINHIHEIQVGAAFILDQIRSMSVTSIAWKGLVTGWGESTAFSGSSVFSAMSIPLTGLGGSLVYYFTAHWFNFSCRILHSTSFLRLVSVFSERRPF